MLNVDAEQARTLRIQAREIFLINLEQKDVEEWKNLYYQSILQNQELRTILQGLIDFTAYDPPTLQRNLKEWRTERDALRTRARKLLGGKKESQE